MEAWFLGCFAFGAVFTLASLALGVGGSHGGHGDGVHFGHGGHAGHAGHGGAGGHAASSEGGSHAGPGEGHGDGQHQSLPLLNLSSLMSFLTVFGAVGYLLTGVGAVGLLLALPVAIAGGCAGALLVAWTLAKLVAGERVMRRADYALEGTLARVSVTIPAEGVGEVVFSKAGSRRGEAARSAAGERIERDTEVVVLAYERGIAVVQPWTAFLAEAGGAGAGPDRAALMEGKH